MQWRLWLVDRRVVEVLVRRRRRAWPRGVRFVEDRARAEAAASLGLPWSYDEGNELWGGVLTYPEESGIRVCRGSRLYRIFSLRGGSYGILQIKDTLIRPHYEVSLEFGESKRVCLRRRMPNHYSV
ncbi:hypothetical protein CRG98_039560 [Punica granatum]|uniref:Uncharacterized protein n=1 Tax=Punica granatum TaxID=22663 RepID=A0A2I0I7R9_PUNGR|nr:hypothetical protein CRG98_039560 [Punica granatum]